MEKKYTKEEKEAIERSFAAYANKVIEHRASDEVKKLARLRRREQLFANPTGMDREAKELQGESKVPLRMKIEEELFVLADEDLAQALMELSQEERNVLIYHVVFRLPLTWIAKKLHLTYDQVRQRKGSAIKRLQGVLEIDGRKKE